MAAQVIERHGHKIDGDGLIHYDDRMSSHEKAEKIAGIRLDRRRTYAIIDGEVCEIVSWTGDCSGCTEIGDYGTKYGPNGCEECGYTGKRRQSMWVKLMPTNNK